MGLYAPDPPDNSALVQANKEIAEESLAFQREQAALGNTRAAELMRIVTQEVQRSQAFADERAGQAREDRQQYDDIYSPLQAQQAMDAANYMTPGRTAAARTQQGAIDAQTRATATDAAGVREAGRDRLQQSEAFAPVDRGVANAALASANPALAREAAKRQGVIDDAYGMVGALGENEAAKAARLNQRYESEYVPIEQRLNADALGYDTTARRDAMAGRAISDVGQAFDAERESAQRRLEGFGVDPSMLRSGALDLQYRMGAATAKAQAGTDARQLVEDVGNKRMSDAAARGATLPGASTATAAAAGSLTGAAATGLAGKTQQAINADRSFGMLESASGVGRDLYAGGTAGVQTGANLGQTVVANNSLRDRVSAEQDVGRALVADSVNVGRGFSSAVGSAYGQAIDSGRAAAGTATSGTTAATNTSQAAGSLYQPAISANTSASNMMYDRANAQQAAWGNSFGGFLSSAIPTLGGAYLGTFAEGGKIPDDMSPSRGAVVDDVPGEVRNGAGRVMLDGGEYVIPRDVVEWKGQEFFETLKAKTRAARAAIPTE